MEAPGVAQFELGGIIDIETLRGMGLSLPRLRDTEIQALVKDLPVLDEKDLVLTGKHDSSCPICMTPFLAVLAEEEMALAMDSPAYAFNDLGVTRLSHTCGHTFCRKDISTWIRGGNDSCPLCRRPLLPVPDATEQTETSSTEDAAPQAAAEPVEDAQAMLERLFMQGNMIARNPNTNNDVGSYEDRRDFSGMYS